MLENSMSVWLKEQIIFYSSPCKKQKKTKNKKQNKKSRNIAALKYESRKTKCWAPHGTPLCNFNCIKGYHGTQHLVTLLIRGYV